MALKLQRHPPRTTFRKEHPMDDAMRARLSDTNVWIRGLYMLLFVIAYNVAEVLLTVIVIFQFVATLITGQPNEPLQRFGRNLSAYFYQIINFLTFNDEVRPYPFADWPDEPVTDNLWTGDNQSEPTPAASEPDSEELPGAQAQSERPDETDGPSDETPKV
jgi:hypothetical protein